MQPLATWNKGGDYWQLPEVDIFGHSVAYSETLPKSGTTRNGQLYERPTWVPPTTGQEFSSSHGPALPTPKAGDGIMGRPRTSGRPIEKSTHLTTIVPLLPTPMMNDGIKERNNPSQARRKSPPLSAVGHLLPTPNATMGDRGHSSSVGGAQTERAQPPSRPEHSSRSLPDTENDGRERARKTWQRGSGPADCHNRATEWGKYATEPNSKGDPRLNAAFAEWMMGLPAGWVTDTEIGLTRAQQLKAIGNGVCPAQAATALTHLLHGTNP